MLTPTFPVLSESLRVSTPDRILFNIGSFDGNRCDHVGDGHLRPAGYENRAAPPRRGIKEIRDLGGAIGPIEYRSTCRTSAGLFDRGLRAHAS